MVSRLTASTEPLTVAKALLEATGASELYVADLDAIQHRNLQYRILLPLSELVPGLMLDAGVRFAEDVRLLAKAGLKRLVLGTETLDGPSELWEVYTFHQELDLTVSIDLHNGELLGDPFNWRGNSYTPRQAVDVAWDAGMRRFILLDLARVGMHAGPGTELLCDELRKRYPSIELLIGGGIRNRDDIQRFEDAGADGVLIASALHDGTLL